LKRMTPAQKKAKLAMLYRQKAAARKGLDAVERKGRQAADAYWAAKARNKGVKGAAARLNALGRRADVANRKYQAIDVKIKDIQGKPVSDFQRRTARRRG